MVAAQKLSGGNGKEPLGSPKRSSINHRREGINRPNGEAVRDGERANEAGESAFVVVAQGAVPAH